MYKILEVVIWKINKISETVIKFIKNKSKEVWINNGVLKYPSVVVSLPVF